MVKILAKQRNFCSLSLKLSFLIAVNKSWDQCEVVESGPFKGAQLLTRLRASLELWLRGPLPPVSIGLGVVTFLSIV